MADNILVLHPLDALFHPSDPARLVAWLEEEGLVRDGVVSTGEHPTGRRQTFRTGRAFADRIVFGDEPRRARAVLRDISEGPRSIEPSAFVRDVCHVVVVGPLEREWFLASGYTGDPTCPACGARADWSRIANEWYASWEAPHRPDPVEVACSACGSRGAPWAFDWERTAAFARWYVEIWHVHRDEATPSPAFLRGLEETTGTAWSFMYYRL